MKPSRIVALWGTGLLTAAAGNVSAQVNVGTLNRSVSATHGFFTDEASSNQLGTFDETKSDNQVNQVTASQVTTLTEAGGDLTGSGVGSVNVFADENTADPNRIASSVFDLTFTNAAAITIDNLDLSIVSDEPVEPTVQARLTEVGVGDLFNHTAPIDDFDFSSPLDPSAQYQLLVTVNFARFGGNGSAGLNDHAFFDLGELTIAAVPEPASLTALAMSGMALRRRRHRDR